MNKEKEKSVDYKSYCVYGHYKDGTLVYVGSGYESIRPTSKSSRSKKWWQLFPDGKPEIRIIKGGMSKRDSIVLEQEIISSSEGLINYLKPNHTKDIDFDYISKYVYYDESSPTCLRWKIDASLKSRKNAIAGEVPKIDQRAYIKLGKKRFATSRVIYCLCNGSIDSDMVIDHIDNNPMNNKIDNLRQVSQSENLSNRQSHSNTKERWITWYENRQYFYVQIRLNNKRFFKTFSIMSCGSKENALESAREFVKQVLTSQ
jgi:hypothetical protein